jgi:hypothetical protein
MGAVAVATVAVAAPAGATAAGGPTGATGPSGLPAPRPTLLLTASDATLGYVGLTASGAIAPVTLVELVPGAPAPVVLDTAHASTGTISRPRATAWRCDRRLRTFQASETTPAGATITTRVSVTTPSCATRLTATVLTDRIHRDHPLAVAVRDRWGLGGLRVGACVSHAGSRPCPTVVLTPGRPAAHLRLRAGSDRHPTLEVYDAYENIRLRLDVIDSAPVLLATGDSEMQILDDDLAADLAGPAGARVIGDARETTAISTPFTFDWPAHAFQQVADDHPDIVAMFLGGNEGFALGGVDCCGPAWSRQYALRVAAMMRTYRQHGAASVYWFLIPTPSKPDFVRLVDAVDRGIEIAAARSGSGVHVFDLRPVFSPGGRYLDTLAYGGRSITVHESDGFHLSASADVIVARLFLSRLRADGLL